MVDVTDGPAGAARLDELAAVTREYATYSRTTHGLALTATGAYLLAATALDASSLSPRVPFAYLMAPALWLVALWGSHRYYQRHGAVIEPQRPGSGLRRVLLVAICAEAAFFAWVATVAFEVAPRWGGPRDLWSLLLSFGVTLALVAVPLLAATVARGNDEITATFLLVTVQLYLPALPDPPIPISPASASFRWVFVAATALMALGMVPWGVRQHLSYRRLERRLASLKGAA